MCCNTHMEVREQLTGVGFLLSFIIWVPGNKCRSLYTKSVHQSLKDIFKKIFEL